MPERRKNIKKNTQSNYIQLDFIFLLLALMIVSILAIYNAQQLDQYNENFALKQTIYFAVGILFVVFVQFIDLDVIYKLSFYFYLFGVLLVMLLYISPNSIARPVNNAKSWFNELPFLTIQPSEIAKIFLILFMAQLVVKHKEKYAISTIKTDFWLVLKLLLTVAVPVAFIVQEPDLGISLVFLFITAVFIILSNIDWKLLSTLIVGGIIVVVLSVFLTVNFPNLAEKLLGIKPYQIERVTTWFDPTEKVGNDRYQIERSLTTIGSGGLSGKGLNNAEVALPEAHTDFVFSIVGESFGFIGSAGVIFIFFLLIYRLVTLGLSSFEFNPFAAYVCFGFMAMLIIHTFQNIGMTIGLMPITGVPLLFLSYGGSTTLSTMLLFGIIYRIAVEETRQQEFLFK